MSAITADVVPLHDVPCDLLSYCGTIPGRMGPAATGTPAVAAAWLIEAIGFGLLTVYDLGRNRCV